MHVVTVSFVFGLFTRGSNPALICLVMIYFSCSILFPYLILPFKRHCVALKIGGPDRNINFLCLIEAMQGRYLNNKAKITLMIQCNTLMRMVEVLGAWSCRTSLGWEWKWGRWHQTHSIWITHTYFTISCAHLSFFLL